MMLIAQRFVKDEAGATAVEYGLMCMLISVAIITILGSLGTNLVNTFSTVNAALTH